MYKAVGYAALVPGEPRGGLRSQAEAIRNYSKKLGLKNTKIYEDFPITPVGKIRGTLGGIFNLLDECVRNPAIILVIVCERSRLKNQHTDVDFIEEIESCGKQIIVVGDSVSKSLLKKLSRRSPASGIEGPVNQSGPVPYGYRRFDIGGSFFIEPHEVESSVVKDIFSKYNELKSFASVQRYLNDSAIKTRRGNEWSRAGLSWLLRNRVYIGQTKISTEFAKTHVAIIDEKLFILIQDTIISRKRKRDD